MGYYSTLFLATSIIGVFISGIYAKINIFDEFIKGVEEALRMFMKIFPSLLALFIAVGLLRTSGVIDIITMIIKPISSLFGIPQELVPLVLLRPISGSASLAFAADIFRNFGTDSVIGRTASVMMGSTETIFYVFALYFGAVGVKNVKYALLVALAMEFIGVLLSCYFIKWFSL